MQQTSSARQQQIRFRRARARRFRSETGLGVRKQPWNKWFPSAEPCSPALTLLRTGGHFDTCWRGDYSKQLNGGSELYQERQSQSGRQGNRILITRQSPDSDGVLRGKQHDGSIVLAPIKAIVLSGEVDKGQSAL